MSTVFLYIYYVLHYDFPNKIGMKGLCMYFSRYPSFAFIAANCDSL